jgi:periplasmic protein TonB
MFEQSIVAAPAMAQKPWTLAASFAAQSAMIGMAILVPLMYPDAIQRVNFWTPIVGPPRAYQAPKPQQAVQMVKAAAPRVFRAGALVAPSSIPQHPAMIQDPVPDAPAISGGGSGEGVPGGFGGAQDAQSPFLAAITKLPPLVAPPPKPVVNEPVKPVMITRFVKVGGFVQEAKLIRRVEPVYPPLARQARIGGLVRLEALISTDGRIMDLRVTSGHPLLVKAAMDAVKQWVYKPTLLNEVPVEVSTEILVKFVLQ